MLHGVSSFMTRAVAGCCIVCALSFACPTSVVAVDPPASIGVYFDAEGTVCHGTIRPGTPGTVYVLEKFAGTAGLAGAEFRFTGVPSSWQVFPVPNSEILVLGDPFGAGASMGFRCQTPENGVIRLYSVLVLAADEQSDVRFAIEPRNPPSNPLFQCPLAIQCEPWFTAFCVTNVPCVVNANQPVPCGGPTAVVPQSWTAMKQLFR